MPYLKLIILVILVASGVILQQSGTVDFANLIGLARQYADRWWLIVLLITIQVLLFTFALTGSSMVWITAALFPPVTSSLMIMTGTTLGAIAAYFFSARLSDDWTRKVEQTRVYRILRREGGFTNLFALRVMPGFPHSIINYSAGILKLRLIEVVAAAMTGSAIKAYVYSVLIYSAAMPDTVEHRIDVGAVWPLLGLSLLILLITLVKRYLAHKKVT